MPGRLATSSKVPRKLAAELVAHAHGRAVQVARARVVAEAGPQMQHVVDRRVGQRAYVGEALHEALVVRNDGRDLRLLQHDLRDPDAVGRAVVLPGKIVAALARVPVQQRRGNVRAPAGCSGHEIAGTISSSPTIADKFWRCAPAAIAAPWCAPHRFGRPAVAPSRLRVVSP